MKIVGVKWVVKYEVESPKWNDLAKFLFDGLTMDLKFFYWDSFVFLSTVNCHTLCVLADSRKTCWMESWSILSTQIFLSTPFNPCCWLKNTFTRNLVPLFLLWNKTKQNNFKLKETLNAIMLRKSMRLLERWHVLYILYILYIYMYFIHYIYVNLYIYTHTCMCVCMT